MGILQLEIPLDHLTNFASTVNGTAQITYPLIWIWILRISNPRNPFSKRIHQIKNPDLDLPKGTRNLFLDLKSVFGFTERNTPFDWSLPLNYSSRVLIISKRERTSSTHYKFYCSYQKITKLKKKNVVQRVMYTSHKDTETNVL